MPEKKSQPQETDAVVQEVVPVAANVEQAVPQAEAETESKMKSVSFKVPKTLYVKIKMQTFELDTTMDKLVGGVCLPILESTFSAK